MAKVNWHALKMEDVLKEVSTSKHGLTEEEARARIAKYGPNVLPEDQRPSRVAIFVRQLKSPLVYVLLIAALIVAALQEFVDMGVILAAVVVNAAIGFWQEWQADNAFAALKAMVKHKARVRRQVTPHPASGHPLPLGEGRVREMAVDASELVPGDIVLLQAGDHVPADARLLQMFDLEINEAALTGESLPVKKQLKPLHGATMLAERTNMVFQGTTVARGKAEAVVVATGKDTAFGEIALLVHKVEDPVTPLQKQLAKLAKVLGGVTVLIALGIFGIGTIQGRSIVEMFLIAVAVAVAAIPEGLLISLTVILAIGMRNMAKRQAIVKRLLAAETLGSVSVICADKTGTLTTGKMSVVEVIAKDKAKAWECALTGNEGQDPTTRGLYKGAEEAKINVAKLNRAFPKLDEMPFDSARKWSATLHRVARPPAGGLAVNVLYVRGAPEKVLAAAKLTAAERRVLIKQIEDRTGQGKRLLAVAYREVPREIRTLKELIKNHTLPSDLVFAGLFALQDPLRPHISEVVSVTHRAGIRTIMITGDHARTAVAIATQAGLLPPPLTPPRAGGEKLVSSPFKGEVRRGLVLTGDQMDALDDEKLAERMKEVNIFARVLPKHKVRIVEAFHRLGVSVAMTGDGVNDAPALKSADIGIAVGSGTDVAKESADVVLTDNNLATIVGAVQGGRNIYENVRKVVAYLLSGSWKEIIIIIGSLLLGLPLPVLAAQILWINLIEDSLPNMALAFDPGEPHVMKEKPRARTSSLMDFEMNTLVFGVGIVGSVLLFGFYLYFLTHGYDLAYTRTLVFAALGTNMLFSIYSIRSMHRYVWHVNPFNNRLLLGSTGISAVLLLAAVYAPPLQHILRTVALSAADWLPLIGLGVINVALIELVKAFFIRKRVHA
ncbi:HAD-IC family P-type ATPase [Candidatus Uhrbacteria bacterium]|nr:HAD-IC family P-type ATPase [Candidatus Uhrbacteria bacterium]